MICTACNGVGKFGTLMAGWRYCTPCNGKGKMTDEKPTVKCRKCPNLIPVSEDDKQKADAGAIFYCSYECYCNG